MIDENGINMGIIKKSLDDFSSLKKDSETLTTIANGIFAKSKITDTKELLVNVGSNVVVKKSIPESCNVSPERSFSSSSLIN